MSGIAIYTIVCVKEVHLNMTESLNQEVNQAHGD